MSSEDEPEPPEKTDICSKRQPKKKTYEDIVSGKDLIVLDWISRNKLKAEILLKFEKSQKNAFHEKKNNTNFNST
jgi:hypothetical protein